MNFDFAWISLFAVLGFLFYAAFAIKHEKKNSKKNLKEFTLGKIKFYTPSWWSVLEESNKSFKFHRTDTKYDWYTICEHLSSTNRNLQEYVVKRLASEEILFDEKATDITEDDNSVRIEGTATKDNETRLYLDIFVKSIENEVYYFESRSSILNGCVEGPYFEELIHSLEE